MRKLRTRIAAEMRTRLDTWRRETILSVFFVPVPVPDFTVSSLEDRPSRHYPCLRKNLNTQISLGRYPPHHSSAPLLQNAITPHAVNPKSKIDHVIQHHRHIPIPDRRSAAVS